MCGSQSGPGDGLILRCPAIEVDRASRMEVLAFVQECENIGRGEDAGMTCWFFMSYARADDKQGDEELIREFFDDLKSAVSIRVTDQSPPVAYLDQANLQPGDSWPDEI